MSATTLIQWADSTANPSQGCGGCELWNQEKKICYAGHITERWKGNPGYPESFLQPEMYRDRMLKSAKLPDLTGQERPTAPWKNGLPRLIFVSDMGDSLSNVKGHEIPFVFLKEEIIDVVSGFSGCRHLWIWLTKRPGRMVEFDKWLMERDILWPDNLVAATSITTAKTAPYRINSLKKVRAKYKALSVEPLWEPVTLDLKGIDWVIVGGESSQIKNVTPQPFDLDWARSLRDQCQQAGAKFFFKQAGSNAFDGGTPIKMKDHHGGDWDEFPADLRIRDFPDGFKNWNQPFKKGN